MYNRPPMYQSRKKISTSNLAQLKCNLDAVLQRRKNVYCKALKRPVSLQKLPQVITERKDAKRRLQAFEVAIDILRNEVEYKASVIKGYACFEVTGYDASSTKVMVHLREEYVQKDRVLFLVSCATG